MELGGERLTWGWVRLAEAGARWWMELPGHWCLQGEDVFFFVFLSDCYYFLHTHTGVHSLAQITLKLTMRQSFPITICTGAQWASGETSGAKTLINLSPIARL